MDILVNVVNQKLKIATNLKSLVEGSQQFVKFTFNLNGDWDGLRAFAQFGQDGRSYNQYLDENNSVYLPAEIKAGTCTLLLYGSGGRTIATTNYLTLTIDENILVANAQSTQISQSLYDQLVDKVNNLTTTFENNATVTQTITNWLNTHIDPIGSAVPLSLEAMATIPAAPPNSAISTS